MLEMKQDMKELIGGQNEMREMCTKMMAMLDAKEKLS